MRTTDAQIPKQLQDHSLKSISPPNLMLKQHGWSQLSGCVRYEGQGFILFQDSTDQFVMVIY